MKSRECVFKLLIHGTITSWIINTRFLVLAKYQHRLDIYPRPLGILIIPSTHLYLCNLTSIQTVGPSWSSQVQSRPTLPASFCHQKAPVCFCVVHSIRVTINFLHSSIVLTNYWKNLKGLRIMLPRPLRYIYCIFKGTTLLTPQFYSFVVSSVCWRLCLLYGLSVCLQSFVHSALSSHTFEQRSVTAYYY